MSAGMLAPETLVLGAVAYDAKVVIIWEGFRGWFRGAGLDLDYVLYSNYDRQVEDLLAGRLDVAWNSPLAWVRARRMAAARGAGDRGLGVTAVAMRDSDCDLTSVVLVRTDSAIADVAGLAGTTVGVGAVDSPQATLIPLWHLQTLGLSPGDDFHVRHHNLGVGKHGDHVGGERGAARALIEGAVDAACVTDTNLLTFGTEGTLPAGATRVLTQTPPYDHCNFTVASSAPSELVERFRSRLLAMDYADPDLRPLLDLEGLKAWRDGRTTGYAVLEAAVSAFGFYDTNGHVSVDDHRP